MNSPTEPPNNMEQVAAKKTKRLETVRKLWLILIPIYGILIIINLYFWSTGKSDIKSIFSPLGMMFIGLSWIFMRRSKMLQIVFMALGIISFITWLVMLTQH